MRFKFRKITAVIAAIVLMVGIMPALNTVAVRADVECSHEDIYVDTTIYSSYPAHPSLGFSTIFFSELF